MLMANTLLIGFNLALVSPQDSTHCGSKANTRALPLAILLQGDGIAIFYQAALLSMSPLERVLTIPCEF